MNIGLLLKRRGKEDADMKAQGVETRDEEGVVLVILTHAGGRIEQTHTLLGNLLDHL